MSGRERVTAHGLTKEINAKIDAKYDSQLAEKVSLWINQVTGSNITDYSADGMHVALKDGTVLCTLISSISGQEIKQGNFNMNFHQMERIGKFLKAAAALGVSNSDSFMTTDLWKILNIIP